MPMQKPAPVASSRWHIWLAGHSTFVAQDWSPDGQGPGAHARLTSGAMIAQQTSPGNAIGGS